MLHDFAGGIILSEGNEATRWPQHNLTAGCSAGGSHPPRAGCQWAVCVGGYLGGEWGDGGRGAVGSGRGAVGSGRGAVGSGRER